MRHRPAVMQDEEWLRAAEMATRIGLLTCERHGASHKTFPVLTVPADHHDRTWLLLGINFDFAEAPTNHSFKRVICVQANFKRLQ